MDWTSSHPFNREGLSFKYTQLLYLLQSNYIYILCKLYEKKLIVVYVTAYTSWRWQKLDSNSVAAVIIEGEWIKHKTRFTYYRIVGIFYG